ncbi:MAG: DUF898 family protein, partial [Burkholderiales bacterium]|nr:DUF898 family protein [Burkholderiales bacterium]
WSNTGNTSLRFKSHLAFRSLFNLSLKNAALTAVTLGLYWPCAHMAWTRARLTAITVHARIRPDQLSQPVNPVLAPHDGTGDAAVELMGLDAAL